MFPGVRCRPVHPSLSGEGLVGFAQKVLEPCADFSRKAAKAQSAAAFQQSSLHLCAFAWESFLSHGNLKYFLCKAGLVHQGELANELNHEEPVQTH